MTRISTLALALGLVAWATTAGATDDVTKTHRHSHRVAGPAVQQPAPPPAPQPWWSSIFKPYAHPGDGDNDGLSRDPDDCNKGCIGGNPG